jgi:hypothetical protein
LPDGWSSDWFHWQPHVFTFYYFSPFYLRLPQAEMLFTIRHKIPGKPRPVMFSRKHNAFIFCVDQWEEGRAPMDIAMDEGKDYAEVLHGGKGDYYIFDYANDELFWFNDVRTIDQLFSLLTQKHEFLPAGQTSTKNLREILVSVPLHPDGMDAIDRIMARDEGVIDVLEPILGYRPTPTTLADEMQLPDADMEEFERIQAAADAQGVDFEEMLRRFAEADSESPPSNDPKVDEKSRRVIDDAYDQFKQSLESQALGMSPEQMEKFLKAVSSNDQKELNNVLQGMTDEFMDGFSKTNQEKLKGISSLPEDEQEVAMMSILEDHLAKEGSPLAEMEKAGRKVEEGQERDIMAEYDAKIAAVENLPEEEQIARLRQISEEMNQEMAKLEKDFEDFKTRAQGIKAMGVGNGGQMGGMPDMAELSKMMSGDKMPSLEELQKMMEGVREMDEMPQRK